MLESPGSPRLFVIKLYSGMIGRFGFDSYVKGSPGVVGTQFHRPQGSWLSCLCSQSQPDIREGGQYGIEQSLRTWERTGPDVQTTSPTRQNCGARRRVREAHQIGDEVSYLSSMQYLFKLTFPRTLPRNTGVRPPRAKARQRRDP